MKNFRNLFKFFLVILLSVTIFSTGKSVYAETFYDYNIEVKIRKNGTAEFTSYIDLEPTRGTEYYFPIENLGSSEIRNFKVFEVVGGQYKEYTFVNNWNIKASISEKANKNGLIKTKNGYELAFGIRDYRRKQFVLKYEVTNFVKKLNDSDMIFWRFVNDKMTAAPKRARVTIESYDGPITNANAKIWGFGAKGEVQFLNDRIEFESLEPLGRSNYVTILSQIDKGLFDGGEVINKNFEEYKEKAFKNSSYSGSKNILTEIIEFIGRYLFQIIFVVAAFLGLSSKYNKVYKGAHKRGEFKGEYYRQVPEMEWWKLSQILKSCNFKGTDDVIRAFFLKWIQKKMLIPVVEDVGTIFKREEISLRIDFSNISYDSYIEENLFKMLITAAGSDGILQKREFAKHLKTSSNRKRFKDITNKLDYISDEYILENDFLERNKKGNATKTFNEDGKEFTAKLIKYYNYLKDFTILNERELLEIKVWKELLIYATLFGVADTVKDRLRNLSPEVLEEIETNIGYDYSTMGYMILYSNMFSNSMVNAYNNAVRSASSGSGGFTSIGGGGGSFGGGSGGGSR